MAYDTDTVENVWEHLEYLNRVTSFADMTHVGDPDAFLLSPCSFKGYRIVYGPRQRLDYVIPRAVGADSGGNPLTHRSQYGGSASSPEGGGNRNPEVVWNWWDSHGGDDARFWTYNQRNGLDGSWVLVKGDTAFRNNLRAGTRAPETVFSKWYAVSQTDLNTPDAERSGGGAGGLASSQSMAHWSQTNRSGTGGFGTLGRHNPLYGNNMGPWYEWQGGAHPAFQEGMGNIGGWGAGYGGERSSTHTFGTRTYIAWVLYGERDIVGFTECKDVHIHGTEMNWSADQTSDPGIFNVKFNVIL